MLSLCTLVFLSINTYAADKKNKPLTMTDVLAQSSASDWRTPSPNNIVYWELPNGRVVMELAPHYAPKHAENIRQLVREGYFDQLAILRSHENYVVQWGDPNVGETHAKVMKKGNKTLAPEFFQAIQRTDVFNPLPDGDVYAKQVGWSQGFPVARDVKRKQTWLTHCYGMVGAGRDMTADSGSGAELYVVIGHAPRHLDRNITLVGRILQGMELLTTIPRGTGALGFFEKPEQRVPIISAKIAADVADDQQTKLEILRTDTKTFTELIETRRNRKDDWYLEPAGKVELCNVPIVVRAKTP